MLALANRQIRLKSHPVGPVKETDFELICDVAPPMRAGQVLVRVRYVAVDPAMRGWINGGESYIRPVGVGDVMRANGVGVVVASNHDDFHAGETVRAVTGLQDYVALPAGDLTRIDPSLAPLPRFLGALGNPGMTAYFGLLDVGQAQPGETVVVSAAAGAVGSIAGQIAKIKGCRVIGIAGGAEKCLYLVNELGFDAAIDYKSETIRKALENHCPTGIDVYFDNVGGDILDDALTLLARKARVVICGAISQYDNGEPGRGPKNYMHLLLRRARMEGFIVLDYLERYHEGAAQIQRWIANGELKTREEIVDGLEAFPAALLRLFKGENNGKLCISLCPDEASPANRAKTLGD